ncbi:MAG: tetratricopeptide repeat protein [Candidatus Hatepunaea meridiana]|nr:tetratricopeptide repeat protein [Candidatus Hatepunaea meridiana]
MLKPRKRLVRAKIREDKFINYTDSVQSFIEKNSRRLLYAILAIVVVFGIGTIVTVLNASKEKQAAFEGLLARDAYGRGSLDEALTHINILLEDYPRTKASAEGIMIKARVHEQRGEITEAIVEYRKVIDKHSDQDYLAFGAFYSLGSIYFGQGEYEEAANYFSEGASSFPENFNTPYSLLEAGKSYKETRNYQKARGALLRIITEYPKSRAVSKARTELEEIEFMP